MGTPMAYSQIADEIRVENSHAGSFGLFDLLCVGVGATVGSGVFVLTGLVAKDVAGPGVVFSWLIAGCACCLSAASFAELSSRFPSSTSSYSFAKDMIGKWPAYLAAWCLTLECGISAAAVARSWGQKMNSLVHHTNEPDTWGFNFYACILQIAVIGLFLAGREFSKTVINVFTVVKVLLISFMAIMGLCLFNSANLQPTMVPMGWNGVLRGATLCFFGFVGYDEVCCLALESKQPSRLLPLAVYGTIVIVCLLYGSSSLALVGMESYTNISAESGFSVAFAHRGYPLAAAITAVGELVLLPLVVVLSYLPQPRILAALARDRLAPAFLAIPNASGNYVSGIGYSGVVAVVIASFVPFVLLNDLISSGVLLSFNFTNTALILYRSNHPAQRVILPPRVGVSMSRCSAWLLLFHMVALLFAWQMSYLDSTPSSGHPRVSHAAITILAVILVGIACALRWQCPDKHPMQASEHNIIPTCIETEGDGAAAVAVEDESAPSKTTPASTVYRSPGVPFVPLLGIVINDVLIAQLSRDGLMLFALYFLVASACFAVQTMWNQQSDRAGSSLLSQHRSTQSGGGVMEVQMLLTPIPPR